MTRYTRVEDIALKKITNKNVLLLADTDNETFCVSEYIKEIKTNSVHEIQIVNPIKVNNIKLNNIEAIIIHYSIYISSYYFLNESWQKKIQKFKKLKLLIIQDEYRHVNLTVYQINKLGFNFIISSLSISNLKLVYQDSKFKNVTFISALPGYISDFMLNCFNGNNKRENDLLGRGSELPNSLGFAKVEKDIVYKKLYEKIAYGMNLNFFKKIIYGVPLSLNKYSFKSDISSLYKDRFYKASWIEQLQNTKCVLGVEGGASIFDFDSSVEYLTNKLDFAESNEKKPSDIYTKYYNNLNNIHHRTLTPRILEAICCGTVLILLEGEFRNIIKPNVHYVPIKRDLSNLWDIIKLLKNKKYITSMRKKAFSEIAMNRKYHFKYFINKLDLIVGS